MSAPASTNPAGARPVTASRAARLASGLPLEVVCKRARVSRRHLLQCERRQDFPLSLAETLRAIYGPVARLDDFTKLGGGARQPVGRAAGGGRPARGETQSNTP